MAYSVDRRWAIRIVRAVAVLAVALFATAIALHDLVPYQTCTLDTSANEVLQGVVELAGLLFLVAALICGIAALIAGWQYSDRMLRRAGVFALLATFVGAGLAVWDVLGSIEWCF